LYHPSSTFFCPSSDGEIRSLITLYIIVVGSSAIKSFTVLHIMRKWLISDGPRDDENRCHTSFCDAYVERGAKAPRLVHEGRVFTRSTDLPDRCVGKLEGRVPKNQSFVVKDAIHEPLTNNVCRYNRPAARQCQAFTGRSGENFTLCSAKVVKQPGGGSCLSTARCLGSTE